MSAEHKHTFSEEVTRKFTEITYYWLRRDLVEKKYAECLESVKEEANKLERTGISPFVVSKKIQQLLLSNCPDLKLVVDQNYFDVYVEIVSAETRIYFNWRDRTN